MAARAKKPLLALACVLIGLGLSACANRRGGPIPYDVPNFVAPDAAKPAPPGMDYRLAPGDTISIIVFRVEDLSRDYEIDPSGSIAVPLIGSVPVAGMTTPEIQQVVRDRLSERYLRNPDVTVTVKNAASRVVTVDGSVRGPGAFPTNNGMTLVKAVALARGTDEFSNPRRVAVFRTVKGQRMAAAFDLTAIRRGEAPDPEIYPGDVVVVDGSRNRQVFRDLLNTLPLLALFRPW